LAPDSTSASIGWLAGPLLVRRPIPTEFRQPTSSTPSGPRGTTENTLRRRRPYRAGSVAWQHAPLHETPRQIGTTIMAGKGILGRKLGMTQIGDAENRVVPVTVVQADRLSRGAAQDTRT